VASIAREPKRVRGSFVEHQERGASLRDIIAITEGDLTLPRGEMPVAISVGAALDQAKVSFEAGRSRPSAHGVIDRR